jgi:uncharacterized protein (TIGR00645 family)
MRKIENVIEWFIFQSRWIQAPIYLGLIIATVLFSVKFFIQVAHLFTIFYSLDESDFMLVVIGLIDISMVVNLLIIIIIGGYWTFVSKIDLDKNKDFEQFSYLGKITPSTLKIKLIISLISISGVHLLETFLNSDNLSLQSVILKISIHLTFVISVLILAYTDKIIEAKH